MKYLQTLNVSPSSHFPTCVPPLTHCLASADLSSAQCIPAPLATPIPVSDDPATPVVTSCSDLSESPSQALPPMPYSVPVSEDLHECSSSIIKDSLLECMPKKVSEVSEGYRWIFPVVCFLQQIWHFLYTYFIFLSPHLESSSGCYPHQPSQHSCRPPASLLTQPSSPIVPASLSLLQLSLK